MKKLVIDTNKLISALISPKGRTAERLIELAQEYSIFACHYLYIEIFNHKNKILKASKLEEAELLELLLGLFNRITFVSEIHILESDWKKAESLCIEIDPKDIPHVALCIHLDCLFWTGDQKMINHLKSKGFDKILEY